jgi:hypothetical protein
MVSADAWRAVDVSSRSEKVESYNQKLWIGPLMKKAAYPSV